MKISLKMLSLCLLWGQLLLTPGSRVGRAA